MRLHHLALGALHVDALAAFYREQFGLAEVMRHHYESGELRSIWLDLGGSLLMIEPCDEAAPPLKRASTGVFLLAFAVAPEERVAWEARLEAAGYPVESRTRYSSYCRDPEGNRIAVSHYPTPPSDDPPA